MFELKRQAYDEGVAAIGTLSPKDNALAEWRARKDAAEFGRLISRLRARKWHRENPEKRAAKSKRYYERGGSKLQLAAAKRRRLEAYKRNPVVCECLECGATWCRVPPLRGPHPEFCGDACRQRYRYQERTTGARRIKRQVQQRIAA